VRRSHLRDRNLASARRILESSCPLETDDLDWDSVGTVVLDDDAIATLVYMRDVEGFTNRPLVGFTAARATLSDPLISRFLDRWQTEEAVHSATLDRYLRAYAQRRCVDVPPTQPPPPPVAGAAERILASLPGPFGAVITTAHMVWGALNELLTLTGYRLLIRRTGDPVLHTLLTRIAAQESRHFSFYVRQAEWRLAANRLARTLLPRALSRAWTPVGVGDAYKPPRDFSRVVRYLLAVPSGRRAVARMDARIASLPGFEGLRLYERMVADFGALAPARA